MGSSVGAMLVAASGVVSSAIAIYGVYQAWETRRLERITRLSNAATMAVRRREAAMVRPLLEQKMETVVRRWIQAHGSVPRAGLSYEHMELYMNLCREVRMNASEKAAALDAAIESLPPKFRACRVILCASNPTTIGFDCENWWKRGICFDPV